MSPESTSKNDIGRQLDRVIEELFEVESKQGRRRKGEKLLLSLWQEDEKTSPSSEDELEDIEALLGNDGDEDSSNTDEEEDDDEAPFHGFPTSEDARPTRLVALIKSFESGEEAFDKNITTFGALEGDNQEEGHYELGNCKEEWKHEIILTTAWRKTQKA